MRHTTAVTMSGFQGTPRALHDRKRQMPLGVGGPDMRPASTAHPVDDGRRVVASRVASVHGVRGRGVGLDQRASATAGHGVGASRRNAGLVGADPHVRQRVACTATPALIGRGLSGQTTLGRRHRAGSDLARRRIPSPCALGPGQFYAEAPVAHSSANPGTNRQLATCSPLHAACILTLRLNPVFLGTMQMQLTCTALAT